MFLKIIPIGLSCLFKFNVEYIKDFSYSLPSNAFSDPFFYGISVLYSINFCGVSC